MLNLLCLLFALNFALNSAAPIRSLTQISKSFPLRRSILAVPSSIKESSKDLALFKAIKSAHMLSLSNPYLNHHQQSSLKIAESVKNDPLLSEVLHMLIPQFTWFDVPIPEIYADNFRKSNAFEEVYQVDSFEDGKKYISVRNGLATIKMENGKIIFTRLPAIQKSFEKLHAIFLRILDEFPMKNEATPASRLAYLLEGSARILQFENSSRYFFHHRILSIPGDSVLKGNYGLLFTGPKSGEVKMTPDHYYWLAGLTSEESFKFDELLQRLN